VRTAVIENMGGGLHRPPFICCIEFEAPIAEENLMKTIKFVVKVIRSGARSAEYVQRIDRSPIQMTSNRKRV